jgi:flagellar motor switch protein FliN/FliY
MQEVQPHNFERLFDVEMNVTVRFGKTHVPLRDVVRFGVGSMIELNRTVDEPVELLVNNSPFALGEVVVIDGYYGVRITEIGSAEERSQTLMSDPGGAAPVAEVV